jgi:DNA-binding beta-propeller fold protein YncE
VAVARGFARSTTIRTVPHRPGRLQPIALALLLAGILALAGCGGTTQPLGAAPRSVRVPGCPGAVGTACPYTRVASIGRRGEGVMRCPEALAFAPDGDLYVADQFSHVVQRFSPSGRFLGQWGSYGSGPGQFGAVDGLAVDGRGEVYVLDSTHARVERFTASGRLLGEWGRPGGALGEFDFGPGFGPDKPPGGGIAVGGGYVYVSDSASNRIVRFDLDGSHPLLWGRPGSAPGQFSSPRGLAVAGDVVYVADEGNHRIQALSLAGRPLYAEGTFGKEPGEFVNPFGVAVDGGRVYAVDDNNNRIVVLSPTLRYLEEWSGEGSFQLSYIRAAAVSPAGRVYVADTGDERVVAFTPTGQGLLAFGTPGISPGQLIAPLGVAADGAGAFVVETYGSRSPIYQFGASLRYRGEWQRGGGAIVGSHWFGPNAAVVAPDGSLWVTDPRNGIVRHLSSGGGYLGALTGLSNPEGVAISPSGDVIYVADTGGASIMRFSSSGHALGRLGSVALDTPVAVAVAPNGSIYVADTGFDRVLEISPSGALLASWGGSHRFEEPSGIAVDSAGQVFVSDRRLDRVQKFSASGRLLAAWGAPGGGLGELSSPGGLAVNCRGAVLVADTANNRVQVFAGAASQGVCTPVVSGS